MKGFRTFSSKLVKDSGKFRAYMQRIHRIVENMWKEIQISLQHIWKCLRRIGITYARDSLESRKNKEGTQGGQEHLWKGLKGVGSTYRKYSLEQIWKRLRGV